MLRRFLSYRSRPDPDLIRENILNSNGEREKKGSPFSLFLPSLSDRRNYLHDLSKNISKLIKIREFIKECQILLDKLSLDKSFIREEKRYLIHQLDPKSYPNIPLRSRFSKTILRHESYNIFDISTASITHLSIRSGKGRKGSCKSDNAASRITFVFPSRGCAFVKIN